ncbi:MULTISPECIES: phosphoenolpyruvate synthase [Natrinema]|uniref:Phosphoenolpyruvate synthase n=1 Tax=Natrinema gari JCM 14663 TaxID=1230459 RepID=L9YVB4_9EURY|nr:MULTISPECIES: phosphoenolpyruvate synthase [Natrinema]AFO58996.1 phosphoenolpyruvate synthase [Natrinema sp. J7-2]ELY77616.1 phosphoenolpyruvate synthase [Natrinema gari JCM 14663]
MAVLWLDEISAGDLEQVGGKGASLGELTGAGLPVPPGFVVTAGTYRSFIEEAEIDEELFAAVDVDVDDSTALADAADRAQELILETPFPDELRDEILESYGEVGDGEAFVAVRSSATAEDLPDASFAGQQETFLNVTEEDLLDRVRECWASLFTQRAIYYRQEQGFDHSAVNIAVVVQQMVDAEKSGVMFTSHPSTGDPTMIIEAAWGLGEAVVSGAVSPDNYVIDRKDRSMDVTVAEKKVKHEKDEATGQTVEREVPEDKRTQRVISDDEISSLMDLGERVEDHYGEPQDVEWAIVEDDVYMLQSRPITTIDEEGSDAASATGSVDPTKGLTDGSGSVQAAENTSSAGTADAGGSGEVIVDGLGSSPGTVSGPAKIVTKLDDLAKVGEGDIIVTEMTMPDMVPAMKRASGIITDEGGMTSHAAIVSRELGVPAIVGTTNATTILEDGQVVTLDGDKGSVLEGSEVEPEEETEPVEEVRPQSPVKPMTATEVKVNVSIPEAAERAAATGADGVGLLRTEHMILSLNQTPEKFIAENGVDDYISELVDGIRGVADEFYPRPVRVRTLDAPSDEFRQLEGGEDEPEEHNPMLGYRGIRRSLDRTDVFAHELEAFHRLYEMGYDNVEIMFPLVNDAEDIYRAKSCMKEAGIDPEKRKWGAMIETPAAALSVEEMAEAGIDFASFGTNDLTQYTLAVDRNNEHVADRFDELHPSVLRLIGDVIETCREHDVETSICGQAGSKPEMVQFLVNEGISSISANIDAVRDVQHEVKRVEQKLLLDSVR